MSTRDRLAVLALFGCAAFSLPADAERLSLGSSVAASSIEAWDIDVRPDGTGLPRGRGGVRDGSAIYAAKCMACHGPDGAGGPMDPLVGGRGTLASGKPVKTVGSYWPYATTIFDFVRRAMPFDRPQSLSADEVYALVAFLLYRNGIIGPDVEMNMDTLPQVIMPNRNGFTGDTRPDVGHVQ